MSEVSMKVQDIEGYRNLFDFNDGACEIAAYLRVSHNNAVVFPMTSTKTNRVIVNVPERGEEITIRVIDMKENVTSTLSDIATIFTDALFMNYHVGSDCVILDDNYDIVADADVYLDGAVNKVRALGVWTGYSVGFVQDVTGDRVLLSVGIGLTQMVVRQLSGTREYEVIHVEEGN